MLLHLQRDSIAPYLHTSGPYTCSVPLELHTSIPPVYQGRHTCSARRDIQSSPYLHAFVSKRLQRDFSGPYLHSSPSLRLESASGPRDLQSSGPSIPLRPYTSSAPQELYVHIHMTPAHLQHVVPLCLHVRTPLARPPALQPVCF